MVSIEVTAKSLSNIVAGEIANNIRGDETVELHVDDSHGAKQALKAIIVARGYLAPIGVDIVSVPAFTTTVVDGKEKCTIRITVEKR